MTKATFLQRLIAYLVDALVLAIATSILVGLIFTIPAIVGGVTGGVGEPAAAGLAVITSIAALAVAIALQFVYFGYLWSTRGKSIGMGLMNIRVARRDGSNPSFLMAGLRGTLGYYISSIVLYIGFLWMLFDEQKETWHDKIFNTQVLQK